MSEINWTQVIDEHYANIYRFCFHYLGNSAEAEDATQIAFTKAWKHRAKLREQSSLRSWLYSIARNVCCDKKRWWKRQPALSDHELGVAQAQNPELMMTLQKFIFELPAKQQEVFILRHWHGFSTEETAALLKIQTGTVKSHLKRAVDTLKRKLEKTELFSLGTTKDGPAGSLSIGR